MRHAFGGSPADYAMQRVDTQLVLRPGATGTAWDAATGGTQYTDLTDPLGAPITAVTADGDGAVAFNGPDGVSLLYLDFGYGRRYTMTASDTGATLAAFMAQGGAPGGWATLDGSGHIDTSQIPAQPGWQVATDVAYGATGNGTIDDTAALQAAVNAAATARCTLYIPAGTYLVSAPIVIPSGEGLSIVGSGWGTRFKLKATSNSFIFQMTGADTRITMRDLTIDGNALEQGTTGTCGGIDAAGAVACRFDNIHFTACRDDGIAFSGMTGGAFGHDNRVIGCLFDQSMASTGPGRGINLVSSNDNQILGCAFEFLGGSGGTGSNTAVGILDQAGAQSILGCTFSGGATNNTKGVRLQGVTATKVDGCHFDGTAGDSLFIAGEGNSIVGNTILSPGDVGTAGQASGIHLEDAAARNVITGNSVVSSPTNGRTRSLIREEAAGTAGYNQISGNAFTVKGTVTNGVADLAAPGTVFTNNMGASSNQPAITSKSLVVTAPAGAVTYVIWRAPAACTVTAVRGYRQGGTGATINATRSGADLAATDLSLSTDTTWMAAATLQNTTVAAGDTLAVAVRSISGTPTAVTIQIDTQGA